MNKKELTIDITMVSVVGVLPAALLMLSGFTTRFDGLGSSIAGVLLLLAAAALLLFFWHHQFIEKNWKGDQTADFNRRNKITMYVQLVGVALFAAPYLHLGWKTFPFTVFVLVAATVGLYEALRLQHSRNLS